MNFGTGINLLGGSEATSALQEAMARRGVDSSILNQQSPASAGFNPAAQPPMPVGNPAGAVPAPQGAPQAATQGAGSPLPASEAQVILKAMSERLKAISEVEKSQNGNQLV